MRRIAGPLELVTAFVSAVIGGLALTTPISLAWAEGTSTLQMELLGYSMPRATAIGCVMAVMVAVFVSTADSPRLAWWVSAAGVVILLVNHLLGSFAAETAPLTTLNYVDSLGGGILLGGAAAAVSPRLLPTMVFTLGALLSLAVGDVSVSAADGGGTAHKSPVFGFIVGSPPLWLIWPTAALAVLCALGGRHADDVETTVELPLRPILAALVTTSVPLLGSEWLTRHGSTFLDILLVAAATVVAGTVAALLLPGRDGLLLLQAVAISAVGGAIVFTAETNWLVPMLVGACVAGLWLGAKLSLPPLGMAAIVALAVLAVLIGESQGAVLAAAGIALAAVTGYCFTAALPVHSASLMLGIAMLFVPGLVVAMHGRVFRETGRARMYAEPGLLSDVTPGVAALLVAVGCAGCFLLVRRLRRPETN
ncbi:hypothetical protein AB0H76_32145 [Nocardia sp. NPDC050712]|uniref:hypothetical protein n=1 Tax=Nocardia sp. NPDC050712 TaxID=3155518 RepID=UPI0033D368CB